VPMGFGLIILRLVQSLIRDVRLLLEGKPPYEGATLFD